MLQCRNSGRRSGRLLVLHAVEARAEPRPDAAPMGWTHAITHQTALVLIHSQNTVSRCRVASCEIVSRVSLTLDCSSVCITMLRGAWGVHSTASHDTGPRSGVLTTLSGSPGEPISDEGLTPPTT
eukprot:6532208-Prymnesium_polylepis.1